MEEPAGYWDALAANFDQEPDHGLRDPATRAAWRDLLRQLIPHAGSQVADLGCGTGSLAVVLAHDGHEVTGVDLSPRMVDLAREKAEGARLEVDWRIGDVSDPALPAGQFDVILCRHVLWAMPHPAAVLGRWIDLLNTTGRLILIEGRWSTGAGLTAEQAVDLIRSHGRGCEVIPLDSAIFWGKEISDERYVLISPPVRPRSLTADGADADEHVLPAGSVHGPVDKNDATEAVQLAPLTRADAELTSEWRYGPELATYDGTRAAITDMLDPANHYHSIRLHGDYLGYVCVGADARVADLPAIPDVDDIGIGLAPERVGRGLSRWLLPAVITALQARGVLRASILRAVVLDWNIRSLTAAQHAGFLTAGEHRVGDRRFIVLTRPRVQPS